MHKRMRLPNGFGQISKLKQRLRNPYRAMVTDHWTDEVVYDTYRRRFVKMCNELGISRSEPHNCRKTFATLAADDDVQMDPIAVKRIMGHAITDITERVYTERSVEWLHKEISKIPCRFNVDLN